MILKTIVLVAALVIIASAFQTKKKTVKGYLSSIAQLAIGLFFLSLIDSIKDPQGQGWQIVITWQDIGNALAIGSATWIAAKFAIREITRTEFYQKLTNALDAVIEIKKMYEETHKKKAFFTSSQRCAV